ncbi:MAG: cell division protein ZapA [Rhodocyclaceae bacterium]
MESLDIQLMGKRFAVSVKPEERETFEAAVALLNEKLQQAAGRSSGSSETLALMTALNIAHDFVVAQRSAGLDLPGHQRRIAAMGQRIEDALAQQEKLF